MEDDRLWQQRHAQDPCRLRLAGIEMKEDQELLRGDGGIDAKLWVKQEWGGRIMAW